MDYSSLTSAISTWATRTYTSAQTDEFIAMAEAAFNRRLRGYQRETKDTLTFTDGIASIPTGCKRILSLAYSAYAPLKQVSYEALIVRNPLADSGVPATYAVSGSSLYLDHAISDDLDIVYAATLTALSSSNATNWLIELAPDAYLFMAKAYQRAFEEEWDASAGFEAKALGIIDDLNLESDVAQFGNATLTIRGATP